ncbi:MAG: cytochrome P450 [Acidimicrobiaceae bacterium]|nr:cytochrome P450 [Acidimicrobiaceae bacterium]
MSSTTSERLWDPFDPAFRADPYPFYDRLRTEAPAYRDPGGSVVVTRYRDVFTTLRSNQVSRDVEKNAVLDESNPIAVRRRERRGSGAKTILNLDPPDHTRLRRLVSKAFTPRAIEQLRPNIAAMVDARLDVAAERGSIELIDDLAFPVPFQVISELLDMPTDRADELRDWSQVLTQGLEPTATITDMDASEQVIMQFVPYLIEVIEQRRRSPGDDLLSGLLAVEDDGDTLSPEELISFVILLYVAGHETTVNLIGNGMLALLRHPDQLELWRHDPSLDGAAVDELLRFDGPVQHTVRVAMEPVVFDGADGEDVVVEPHHTILTVLGAANHDPAMFDDPHRLWLQRPNAGKHTAFSAGIHYCLGASLAKLEASVAITRFIRRFDTIELAGDPHFRDRITIRGVDHLPLTVR